MHPRSCYIGIARDGADADEREGKEKRNTRKREIYMRDRRVRRAPPMSRRLYRTATQAALTYRYVYIAAIREYGGSSSTKCRCRAAQPAPRIFSSTTTRVMRCARLELFLLLLLLYSSFSPSPAYLLHENSSKMLERNIS